MRVPKRCSFPGCKEISNNKFSMLCKEHRKKGIKHLYSKEFSSHEILVDDPDDTVLPSFNNLEGVTKNGR